MKKLIRAGVAVLVCSILVACAPEMVLVVVGLASAGYFVYGGTKIYQTGSGAEIRVTVYAKKQAVTPEDRSIVSSIKTIAVANDDAMGGLVADGLRKRHNVIGPYTFSKTGLEKISEKITDGQTTDERIRIFSKAGKAVAADAVCFGSIAGKTKDAKNFSLNRGKEETDVLVYCVSPRLERAVYERMFKLVVTTGVQPSEQEINKALADAIVEQFEKDVEGQ